MTLTVVFDLDGTLADTSGDMIAAANACFQQMGAGDMLDHSTDQGTALRGGRAMLRLGFSRLGAVDEAEVDRWYAPLLTAYAEALDIHTTLYPGTMEAVERIRARGGLVAICTNKPEALAERLMRSLGVRGAFGALVGADTLAVRKPDPSPLRTAITWAGGLPERGVLVGDTITDRETARAAGLPSILVTFGPAGDEVRALQPEGLLDHYDNLDAVLAQVGL